MSDASHDDLIAAAREPWQPNLGPERVVEGIHYGWLMADHIARYRFALEYCRGKTVLDVATGTGYGANILQTSGAARVAALDCNHDALAYARNRYGEQRALWIEGDALRLPLPSKFDVAVSFETIEHLADPDAFLREVSRCLKPGGVFLVSTPLNTGGAYVSPCHEKEYTLDELRSLLQSHFPSVEMYGQRRVLQERIRVLGDLPHVYSRAGMAHRVRLSVPLYRAMNVVNKLPNVVLAWLSGCGESYRRPIRPIDAPKRESRFITPDFLIMIGVCRKAG